MTLLEVRNLEVTYPGGAAAGQKVGIAGESGYGKEATQ